MGPQTDNFKQRAKGANPLNDIAANLGVTPKILTELATGDDKEFRELVRGIFSILPENEVAMVAGDPDIHPEFLDYLCKLFDSNQKILLTILQNQSSHTHTKQFILDHLSNDVVSAIAQSPKTSPVLNQMITQRFNLGKAGVAPPSTADEFKIKMKVSRLLNDLEANLGVSIEAFMKIKSRDDAQSREFIKEVYIALPEDHVLIVGSDPGTTPLILNYLSQLFDKNTNVLSTILQNPTADDPTRRFILERLPEDAVISIAGNPKAPPALLRFFGAYFTHSEDMQMVLLANPATPTQTKHVIHGDVEDSEIVDVTEDLLISDDQEDTPLESEETADDGLISDFFGSETEALEPVNISEDIDAKIDVCVKKIYAVNADIVSQFVKKAHVEILKRLKLAEKANRLILTTLLKNPSLTREDIDKIDMKIFIALLNKVQGPVDEKTVLKFLRQAQKNTR